MDGGLKIAVTGGSGSVGHCVIAYLLERGHHPVNLDRKQARPATVPFIYCDCSRREMLQPALVGMDAVIHLGEIPGGWLDAMSAEEVFARNTASGSCVFQTAVDLGIRRVVYASTCQVYGTWGLPSVPPLTLPMDETHPLQPTNCYSLSKVANESYARYVAQMHGQSIAVFRLPLVYAWSDNRYLIRRMERTGEPIEEMGVIVGGIDVARAFAMAIERPRPGFEAYHLSAADVMSLTPLRQRLAAECPNYPLLPADWPGAKSPVITTKAKEHFGWEPIWNPLELYHSRHQRKDGAAA